MLDSDDALARRDGTVFAPSVNDAVAATREQILYVTPEISDFIKAGGLGDVSSALPRALRAQCDVRVIVPGYRQLLHHGSAIRVVGHLPASAAIPACDIGRIDAADGLVVYVVLCAALYDRDGGPYGDNTGQDWPDNDIRFARLSLAAVEMARGSGDAAWQPDVLHLNDWPAALASGYAAWRDCAVPTLLTIHNLAYQGLFDPSRLADLDIPSSAYAVNGVEFHGKLSFMKAGIFYASHVTTVSGTYAREITTPEFGCGLDGILRERDSQGRLSGITNGIDASWDPGTDPYLARPFQAGRWHGKRANAAEVRTAFGLEISRGPLFAIVSRLVHQKGIDLAVDAAESIVSRGGQIVAIGRGEPRLEEAMVTLAERHPGNIGVRIGYEEAEARRMFAGSDFLLMPSRFEPCGLSRDVCPALRLITDRASDGWPCGYDRGRYDRLSVRRTFRRQPDGCYRPRLRRVPIRPQDKWDAAQSDGETVRLAALGRSL